MRSVLRVAALCTGLCVLGSPAFAEPISDPVGDFLSILDPDAPRGGDLDVVSAETFFNGSAFLFSGTMDAPIGTTPLAFYVWGVDRGAGAVTADFAHLDLPDIVFDAVLVAFPDGTGVVNLFPEGPTPLPPGAVTFSGNTIDVLVPLALLPSNGFAPADYGWNLWPRWDGVPFGDTQISDFAPDDSNAGMTVVPEPALLSLLALGLAVGGRRMRKRLA